jgi:hypothetical protein
MNDIDFIKKCCEYADGFEYHNNPSEYGPEVNWKCGYKDWIQKCGIIGFEFSPLMPLLLQRAIEGVNNSSGDWIIEQHPDGIELYTNGNGKENDFFFEDIDAAKRLALEYIFEQED